MTEANDFRETLGESDVSPAHLADDSSVEVPQQDCPCGQFFFLEVMLRHRDNEVRAKLGLLLCDWQSSILLDTFAKRSRTAPEWIMCTLYQAMGEADTAGD
jgi:hypothetical protein